MAWLITGFALLFAVFALACWCGQETRHKKDIAALEEAVRSGHATIDFLAREHNRAVNDAATLRKSLEWLMYGETANKN